MIRRSPVVILDDSLSAVDGNTEKAIVTELKSRRQARAQTQMQQVEAPAKGSRQTVLIVSHRLATLKHADRIVVLDRGAIEAIGRHEELLEISPTYRALNQLQSAPITPAAVTDILVDDAPVIAIDEGNSDGNVNMNEDADAAGGVA